MSTPTVDVEEKPNERLESWRMTSLKHIRLYRASIPILAVFLALVCVVRVCRHGKRVHGREHDIYEHGGEVKFEEFDWYKLQPRHNITWTDCFAKHKCARLSLPLDYTTPNGPMTEIALPLHPATDISNYKGSILVNPGGPGASGTAFVAKWGDKVQKIVGPEVDILGFGPRGTGASTPQAQCFDSEQQYQQWSLQALYPLVCPDDFRSLATARGRETVLAERCARAIGGNGRSDLNGTAEEWGIGRFMSTAHVVTWFTPWRN